MSRRVILVRAVNVGGTAKLPMADFRAMLNDLGAQNPRTYIASGNAVVDIDARESSGWATFDRSVERELKTRFGYQRDVISRSVEELAESIATHPFRVDNPAWSYVTFLTSSPTREEIANADGIATGHDEWAAIGRQLHLRYHDGMSNATLKTDALMKRLGATGTARNLRTVQAILDLAQR